VHRPRACSVHNSTYQRSPVDQSRIASLAHDNDAALVDWLTITALVALRIRTLFIRAPWLWRLGECCLWMCSSMHSSCRSTCIAATSRTRWLTLSTPACSSTRSTLLSSSRFRSAAVSPDALARSTASYGDSSTPTLRKRARRPSSVVEGVGLATASTLHTLQAGNLLLWQVIMTKLIPITGVFRRNLPNIKEAHVIRNPEVIGVINLTLFANFSSV
jgi:hypothetical protein